jgi:flavin-dependent dehydrogenase
VTERDVVIVGGGPAGGTTALALAFAAPELAKRIVVVEKGKYPREKYCAGALGMRGEKILAKMNAVPDVPSVPVDGISFAAAGGETVGTVGAIGRVVRRIEFDHALAKIVASRGIEVRDGTRVDAVRSTGDGAVVETSAGEIHAKVVVGADGVGSIVRKALGLSAGAMRAQVLEVDTEPLANERPRTHLHFDATDRSLPGYTWDFPTLVDGREMVCRGIYHLKVTGEDVDIQASFGARLARMGIDLASCKNKRYAERGFDPAEKLVDGNAILVGEAAGIDPVTGEGIAQAIEFGALAGRFLARTLRGDASLSSWDRVVARSRLSYDLRIRRRFASLFYGPARPEVERWFVATPDAIHVGCEHFAAMPYDPVKLATAIAKGAVASLAWGVGRALGSRE